MQDIKVENIEELANLAQNACYKDQAVNERQMAETKQFYMMGFFEGMQMGNKMPKEVFDKAFEEVCDSIQKRIMELMNQK